MKSKRGRSSRGSGNGSSNLSALLLGTVLVALAALVVSRKEAPDELDDDVYEPDSQMEHIRSALLKDGEAKFTQERVVKIFEDNRDSDADLDAALKSYRKETEQVSKFSDESYWDERYSKGTSEFDWFGTWNDGTEIRLKPFVEPLLPSVSEVLNLGCGNSRLAEELHEDGFASITNIDISQVAIDQMLSRLNHLSGLQFLKMDVMNMTFADSSFDLIFDKGTLDALYTGSRDWVKLAMPEIYRVLRPGGLFVSMSFGSPINRKLLNATHGEDLPPGWVNATYHEMQRQQGQSYHLYLMKKPA